MRGLFSYYAVHRCVCLWCAYVFMLVSVGGGEWGVLPYTSWSYTCTYSISDAISSRVTCMYVWVMTNVNHACPSHIWMGHVTLCLVKPWFWQEMFHFCRHSLYEARYEKTREFQTRLLHYCSKSDNKSNHHHILVSMDIWMDTCMSVWMLTRDACHATNTHVHIHYAAHTYTHTYIHICVNTDRNAYTYTCIHTYVCTAHTYIHTYTLQALAARERVAHDA